MPNRSELTDGQYAVYRAYYCGMCKAMGRLFGQVSRLTVNYDMTFVAALLHDIAKQEVVFDAKGCITGPKKKTYVTANPLLDRLAAANVILAYHKLNDDVLDNRGIKRRIAGCARRGLKKAIGRAAKTLPQVDAIVVSRLQELRELELAGCDILDKACHPFAALSSELAELVLEQELSEDLRAVCYNIGKYVYLIDALDDIEDDYKKKRYNPILFSQGREFGGRQKFYKDNSDTIDFVMTTTLNRAAESLNNLPLTQCGSLLKNIVHKGLRNKLSQVLSSCKKVGSKGKV